MKTLRLILLVAVLVELASLSSGQAQIYSPRRLTRRIAPQPNQAQPPTPVQPAPAPAPASPPPAAVPVRPASTQAVVRIAQPPVDPEKAKAAKEEALRKTVEFQKKRAEEGSESAQYELGLRYLKGEGVDKDEATGRKWLEESSKNGYEPATKKLEDLRKPTPAPAPTPVAKHDNTENTQK